MCAYYCEFLADRSSGQRKYNKNLFRLLCDSFAGDSPPHDVKWFPPMTASHWDNPLPPASGTYCTHPSRNEHTRDTSINTLLPWTVSQASDSSGQISTNNQHIGPSHDHISDGELVSYVTTLISWTKAQNSS